MVLPVWRREMTLLLYRAWLWVSKLCGQWALSSAEEKNWGTLSTDEWLLEFINYISHKQLVLTKVSGKKG